MLLTFESGGSEVFNFLYPDYIIKDISGLEGIPVDPKMTKAPYQEGKTLIDIGVDERFFDMTFTVLGGNKELLANKLDIVNRVFNTKLGMGKLTITKDNNQILCIDCVPLKMEKPSGDAKGDTFQEVLLPFVAPNPYLYDPTEIEKIMVGFEGGFSFPFSFPVNFGKVGTQVEAINVGTIETSVVIYVYGEVENPVIKNLTTGEEISVVKTILDGELLIINTAFGEKGAIILSGGEYTNAFEYVDPESTFWKLVSGNNTVKYTVVSENENAQCRIYYYNRYGGI